MCAKYSSVDWDDVRVFLAVARQGQILGAARSLDLNHATVARRVSALESALGVNLLARRTNGSELTGEGERFLVYAEQMESMLLAAREETGAPDEVVGTVRIGAPDGFGVAFLAPRLGLLADRFPRLKIELVPVPRAFSLSRREADVAVTLERPTEGRLVARKLTDYRLGLYASNAYLERHGTPASLEELSGHRLVGYVDDLLYASSLRYTEDFLKGWTSAISVSSAIGQTEAVSSGAGIGILHGFMVTGRADLVPVLPGHSLIRSYWIVIHEALRNVRRVTVVSDFISGLVAENRPFFT
jgi:DNA-binding transcriptional LysR family regulator